jgi:hypothetical protein
MVIAIFDFRRSSRRVWRRAEPNSRRPRRSWGGGDWGNPDAETLDWPIGFGRNLCRIRSPPTTPSRSRMSSTRRGCWHGCTGRAGRRREQRGDRWPRAARGGGQAEADVDPCDCRARLDPSPSGGGYGLHSSLAAHSAMNRSTTVSIGRPLVSAFFISLSYAAPACARIQGHRQAFTGPR